jgi:hypothetical protein
MQAFQPTTSRLLEESIDTLFLLLGAESDVVESPLELVITSKAISC